MRLENSKYNGERSPSACCTALPSPNVLTLKATSTKLVCAGSRLSREVLFIEAGPPIDWNPVTFLMAAGTSVYIGCLVVVT